MTCLICQRCATAVKSNCYSCLSQTLVVVFAQAFESLSAEAFDKLGQDRDKLESILKSHMISG